MRVDGEAEAHVGEPAPLWKRLAWMVAIWLASFSLNLVCLTSRVLLLSLRCSGSSEPRRRPGVCRPRRDDLDETHPVVGRGGGFVAHFFDACPHNHMSPK